MVAVGVAAVNRIGIEPYIVENISIGQSLAWQQHEQQQNRAYYALWKTEREAAATTLTALDIH